MNEIVGMFGDGSVYLHGNVKLKNGGRIAPKISPDEFERIVDNLEKKALDKGFISVDFGSRVVDGLTFFAPVWGYKGFSWIGECASKMFPKFVKDVSKIDFGFGNFKIEDKVFVTNSGIPYLRCCAGDEGQLPVLFFLYWDGGDIRGYVPTKGNIFNKREKRAIDKNRDGFYILNEIRPELVKKYSREQIDEYMKEFDYDTLKFQEEWCVEDFESRLEVVDTDEKEIDYYINELNKRLGSRGFHLEETDDVCEDFEREWIIVTGNKALDDEFEDRHALVFAYENDEYDVSMICIDMSYGEEPLYENKSEKKVLRWIGCNLDLIEHEIIRFYNEVALKR